jgi:dCMP deaminase
MGWDERYMRIANEVAAWSKDPSTRVGAVLVGVDGEIASTGFNGFPRGVADDPAEWPARYDPPMKYEFTVHAELNAILNAARLGVSTVGKRLYAWETPCHDCAKAIVQAGISEVIIQRDWFDYTWTDPNNRSAQRAWVILTEGGVTVRSIEDHGEEDE